MNRILIEAKFLQKFKSYFEDNKEICAYDDLLNARYCICAYPDNCHTLIFYFDYEKIVKEDFFEDVRRKISSIDFSIDNAVSFPGKPILIFLDALKKKVLKEEIFPLKALNLIDNEFAEHSDRESIDEGCKFDKLSAIKFDVGMRIQEAEVVDGVSNQIQVLNEFPIVEGKSLATLQSASVSQQLDQPTEAQDHMECEMDINEFSKLMSGMRKKLPSFDMSSLSIDVSSSCKKFGNVKINWNARNEYGRIYIWEVSKLLASSLLKNEAKEVKQIEKGIKEIIND